MTRSSCVGNNGDNIPIQDAAIHAKINENIAIQRAPTIKIITLSPTGEQTLQYLSSP